MKELLSYDFFIRVLIASVLISVACGIVGTYITTRRIVFFSGSISHASFGGIGIGYYLGFNPIAGAAIFAVITAFVIQKISEKQGMRMDSIIGILWSFGMAIGLIFIFMTPGYAPNLTSYLFGNILTVSPFDIACVSVVTCAIIIVFILFFREILYIAFDEEYALTLGIPVRGMNYLMLCLIALTIVISIKAVGIILVISLLTIPQVTASLITGDFKKMIFLSIGFALFASLAGLLASYAFDIPSGASIIFTAAICFALTALIKTIYMHDKKI